MRGVAQPGSASVWGTGGRWFKSSRPDHIMKKKFKIFYSTTSNLREGKKIALKLLNQKKAICVNIVKDVNSFYLDEKKIVNQTEVILIIKTFHTKKELEVFFEKEHNYSTPLIVEIKTGTPNEKYLDWFLNTSSDIKS